MAGANTSWSTGGDGQASTTSSLSVQFFSGVAVGEVATLSVTAASPTVSLTGLGGFTVVSGPDVAGGMSSWLLTKSVATGDPGSSFTLTFSTAVRCEAVMLTASGTTATAYVAKRTETTSTSSPTVPALANVPQGAFVAAFLNRYVNSGRTPTLSGSSGFTDEADARTSYSFGSDVASLASYLVAGSSGSYGGGVASSWPSSVGVNYLVYLPSSTLPPDVTTTGVSATATAASDPGTATAGITVVGVSATATAATDPGSTVQLLPPSGSTDWPPAPYRDVIRAGGYSLTYTVDAFLKGVAVPGVTGLRPIGGSITDTTKPGVRRTLSLDLAPEPGLYDNLAPVGMTLVVTAHVQYPNRYVQDIPMGVFDVDQQSVTEGGGKLSLTAPDKWVRIQRARFVVPTSSSAGIPVTQQIVQLIQGALGGSEQVRVLSTSTAVVGALTWDSDRDKAIIDLAQSIGAWVYFDRYGTATIADLPVGAAAADWLIDASPSGVLVELARQKSRTNTCNVVQVESSTAGDAAFPAQTFWDNDPLSQTYAGPDPVNHPELAGPFGVVVFRYPTPLPLSAGGAMALAATLLASKVGLSSQVSLSESHNPAIDAYQSIDVLAPFVRYDIPQSLERHVVDTVTHPLDVSQAQTIDGRSTTA